MASVWLHAVGTRLRRNQRHLLTGAFRGLLVSPWFAAGAGFVIAAGAFIYAPHAELQFGGAIHREECAQAGCHQTAIQGAPGMPAGTGEGKLLPAHSASPRPSLPTGLTFRYLVVSHEDGMFAMVLSVTSTHAIGSWRLAFVVSGATKLLVYGNNVQWQPTGADSGTATGTGGDSDSWNAANRDDAWSGDQPSPGPSVQVLAGQGGNQEFSLYVVVYSAAGPTAPTNCSYNGAPCQFTET